LPRIATTASLGSLALLGVLAPVVGAASAKPPAGSAALRRVEVLWERNGAEPGGTVGVAVRVALHRDYHINDHVPSQPYLIPTSIEVEDHDTIRFGPWNYPGGDLRKFPYAPQPLRVYEGTVVIRGEARVTPGARPGPATVRGSLRYQACTRSKCYPPAREAVEFVLRVVPRGAATRSLHPDLFPPPARGGG
jgi:hypothetical protein